MVVSHKQLITARIIKKFLPKLEGIFFDEKYYFFPVRSTRRGAAIQIDEYAPTKVPNIRARVNPLILSGPKKNIATRTMIIVNVVKSERRIVSQIEVSMSVENVPLLDFGC
mgnify:FL=1